MKKFIKWNGYAIGEVFVSAAALMLAGHLLGVKTKPKVIASVGAIGSVIWGAQAFAGCASLTNKTNRRIYCKDENSDELIECLPSATVYNIDGFAWNGKVYKVSDGVQATLEANGEISYNSLAGLAFHSKHPTLDERLPGWGTLFDVKDK